MELDQILLYAFIFLNLLPFLVYFWEIKRKINLMIKNFIKSAHVKKWQKMDL